jgi:hypothetical protein
MSDTTYFNLSNAEEVAKFLKDSSYGLFAGKNENDETVHAVIAEDGMEVTTFQSNGWVRVDTYSTDGLKTDETYDGRWNK